MGRTRARTAAAGITLDTGALIALDLAGELEVLRTLLGRVSVTKEVAEEVSTERESRALRSALGSWIEVVAVVVEPVREVPEHDEGEQREGQPADQRHVAPIRKPGHQGHDPQSTHAQPTSAKPPARRIQLSSSAVT